jgi:hypothetical protein
MPIDVSEALDADTAERIAVTRFDEGNWVDGRWEQGIGQIFYCLASVQQPNAALLEILPEGERNKDVRLFICNKPIYSAEDTDSKSADLIHYKGGKYKAIHVADWFAYGHFKVMGVRIDS